MQRETTTIKTQNGYEVEVKAWLNEAESREIQKFWSGKATITTKDGVDMADLKEGDVDVKLDIASNPTAILEYHDVLMQAWVLKVNGEEYTNEVGLAIRKEDYREVVNYLLKGDKEAQKKTSETETPTGHSSSEDVEN